MHDRNREHSGSNHFNLAAADQLAAKFRTHPESRARTLSSFIPRSKKKIALIADAADLLISPQSAGGATQ
jgi:hypothetical protein